MLIDLCNGYWRALFSRRRLRTRVRATSRDQAAIIESLESRKMLTILFLGPTITEPSAVSVNQNSSITFTGANAISISDVAPITNDQLSVAVSHGTLTANSVSGVTMSGSGSGTLFLSGSPADINTALASLTYHPSAGYSGSDSMGIFVQSTVNLLSDNAAVAITVTPSNPGNPGNPGNPTANAPVITAPVSVSVSSTGGYNFGGTISLADSIVGVEQFSMTVQHGTLTLGTTTGLTISGNGNATVIMSGSLQAINAGLASLHYQPTSGYSGADKLSMYVVNATSNLSASSAVTLNVSPSGGTGPGGNTNTNGAPAISAPSAANVPQDTTFGFTGPNAISVSDPVNGIEQFSIVVNHGILNFGSTTGMTVSGNSSRIVILSGTLANLNAALTTLTYTPTTGYVGSDNLTMTDQNSSNNLATSAAIALTVGGSNNQNASPSLLGPVSAAIGPTITGLSGITLTDPTTGIEQLSLAVQNGVLNVTPIQGVTTSGNGTGTLLLSGTASDLNTVLSTLTYTPAVGNLSNTDNLGVFVQNTTSNLTSDLGIPLTLI